MFTLKVGKAEQYHDIAENETRLRVPFKILEAKRKKPKVMTERVESFPIGTTLKDIKAVLSRHLTVYTEDWQRHEATKARQEELDQSQKVVEGISNLEIN